MQYLTGRYTCTLDGKGRVSLPAPLRKYLNESTFYLIEGFERLDENKKSLKLYNSDQYNKMINELMQETNIFSTEDESLRLHILGSSYEVEIDKAGRIPIPQSHREFAGLSKGCVILGQGNHIAIWDETRFRSYKEAEANNQEFAASLKDLSLRMRSKGLN